MDAASRLIAELQDKLRELDEKVLLYRRDMAAQFTKYTDDLLRDLPADVSATVIAAVAESIRAYPSLRPELPPESEPVMAPAIQLTNVGSEIAREIGEAKEKATARLVPAPIILGKAETVEDIPRSPHARENEFLGVFTQGYLPLLDSSDKHERRSRSVGTLPLATVEEKKMDFDKALEVSTGSLSASYSPPSIAARKPPRRRNTEDATSLSDPGVHHPVRRSALRRNSMSSRSHSLRRVRFEFQGMEFPTTSSPTVVETPLATAMGAEDSNGMSIGADEDEATEEQVEDIEEEEVVPKRISSSQALRMLSRGPIEDDGTQWDEVRAPADGSPSVSITEAGSLDSDGEDEEFISMRPKSKSSLPSITNGVPTAIATPAAIPIVLVSQLHRDDSMISAAEAAEEEDILSEMAPLTPMRSNRTMMPNNSGSPSIPIVSPGSNTGSNTSFISTSSSADAFPPERKAAEISEKRSKPKAAPTFDFPTDSEEEDDLFAFEDSSGIATPRPERAPSPTLSDEDSSSSSAPASPERAIPASLSAYATSPARPIGSTASSGQTMGIGGSGSFGRGAGVARSLEHKPVVGSSLRNSYHPFSIPVVSEDIHEEARLMGEVSSFVGSVRGTTGMDEWDGRGFTGSFAGGGVGSLRSGGVEAGQPRSFSERFAVEEWAREREGEGRRGAK